MCPVVANETHYAYILFGSGLETVLGDQGRSAEAVNAGLGVPVVHLMHVDDHLRIVSNTHCPDIPRFDDEEGDGWLGLSHLDGDVVSNESASGDEGRFFTDLKDAQTHVAPDAVIDRFDGEKVAASSRDFSFITSCKYCNTCRRMWSRSSNPHD